MLYYLYFVYKVRNFIVGMIKKNINYRSYEAQVLDQVYQRVKIMFMNTLFFFFLISDLSILVVLLKFLQKNY